MDSSYIGRAKSIHLYFHGTYGECFGHCARHIAKLRNIVPIAAVEYFLYILLSIHYESGRFVLCFGGARHCHQRHHDLYAATTVWWPGTVVCYANHRDNRCGVRSVLDGTIYAKIIPYKIKKSPIKGGTNKTV